VIFLDKSPVAMAVVTSAMLRHLPREVRRHGVHIVGQVLPGARQRPRTLGLTAEAPFGTHFAGQHASTSEAKGVEADPPWC